jgi:hypothetical protein
MMRARIVGFLIATSVAAVLLASSASAASVKLSLTAHGLPAGSGGAPSAETVTHPQLSARLKGKLAKGVKVRLALRVDYPGKFKLLKGSLKFHHGSSKVRLSYSQSGLVAYKLEAVSRRGKVIGASKELEFFWIAPPTELSLNDGESSVLLEMPSGQLENCLHPDGPGTCEDQAGYQAGTPLQLTLQTDTDRIAGSKLTMYFNNQLLCSNTEFDGICFDQSVQMPATSTVTYVPLVGEYTNPEGQTFKLTDLIKDSP